MNHHKSVTLWAVLVAAGCGDTGDSIEVSGTVTYDGGPLEVGQIVFTPAEGDSGRSAGAPIENGIYRIPAAEGLHAGEYTITITVGDMPDKTALLGRERGVEIFQARESQMFTRTIRTDDGRTSLDFDLDPSDTDSPQ